MKVNPVNSPSRTTTKKSSKKAASTSFAAILQDSVASAVPEKTNEAQSNLRKQVEKNLDKAFRYPQLIDRISQYLSEVVEEDPQHALLLGIPHL